MKIKGPREKLRKLGAHALSDTELLAIFLRTGSPGQNVLELAGQMLDGFGSLYQLMTSDKAAFGEIKGSAMPSWHNFMRLPNWRSVFSPVSWPAKAQWKIHKLHASICKVC